MSLELDTKQELKNGCRTIAEMGAMWWETLRAAGLPDDVVGAMVQDWFRVAILPSLAPDPFSDIKAMMDKMMRPDDD